jgi:hypothetical protein
MEKKYLLMLTAAVAAGYGLGEADLLEAQAKPIPIELEASIVLGPAAASTFETFTGNQLCPAVDTAFALSEGTCTIDLLKQYGRKICLSWVDLNEEPEGPDSWQMYVRPQLPGQWVPD